MPKLSALLAEKAKVDVQVGGSTVEFTFYVMFRERFSDEEWTQLAAVHGRPETMMALARVIESWDIVDDSGTGIPISVEAFDQYHLPDALLFALERRIFMSDLAGKVLRNSNSSSGI
jgi:hypothetical protein